jgi:hypothetical protein
LSLFSFISRRYAIALLGAYLFTPFAFGAGELLQNDTVSQGGRTLYRVRRLSDGLLGGYIESEANLSQTGNCFLFSKSRAFGNARIRDNAQVYGLVYDDAQVSGDAQVYGQIFGHAQVKDRAVVHGQVYERATVKDDGEVFGQAYGNSVIKDNAKVYGLIYGHSTVSGNDIIYGQKGD